MELHGNGIQYGHGFPDAAHAACLFGAGCPWALVCDGKLVRYRRPVHFWIYSGFCPKYSVLLERSRKTGKNREE